MSTPIFDWTAVPTEEGVSQQIRREYSTGLTVDSDDNCYILTDSGIAILKKNTQIVQKYAPENGNKMSDGSMRHGASVGHAVDIAWDSNLKDRLISHQPLCAALGLDSPATGGLWILDDEAHALRLVVGDKLITVVGGIKKLHRDGVARVMKDVKRRDAFASLDTPRRFVRLPSSPKVVIFEDHIIRRLPRVRILDMQTWQVSTLQIKTDKLDLNWIDRCFSGFDPQSHPSTIVITSRTSRTYTSQRRYQLDLSTGDLKPFDDWDSIAYRTTAIASNERLYQATWNSYGLTTLICTSDEHILASIFAPPSEYAFLASTNALIRADAQGGFSMALDCFSNMRSPMPWKRRLKCEDVSHAIDNDFFPGDLLLVHDASGCSWRVHTQVLQLLWPPNLHNLKFSPELLANVIKSTLLSSASVNAFILLLHGVTVFKGLNPRDKLLLALELLSLGSLVDLDWPSLLPWFASYLPSLSDLDLCECFLQIAHDPRVLWRYHNLTMRTMGVIIGDQCLPTFKSFHASYTPAPSGHADLLKFILDCSKMQLHYHTYDGSGGLRAECILWYPLRPTQPGQSSLVDEFHSRFVLHSSVDGKPLNAALKPLSDPEMENFILFTIEGVEAVAAVRIATAYVLWSWFRRLYLFKHSVEVQTRIIQLPSWVTLNIGTAIIESVLSELQVELTPAEACTVLEYGAELELFGVEGVPIPPFARLLNRCVSTLQHVSDIADRPARIEKERAQLAEKKRLADQEAYFRFLDRVHENWR